MSLHGVRHMFLVCLLFGTYAKAMFGPCWGAMCGLYLFPDQLGLKNFQTKSACYGTCLYRVYFFRPYWDQVWPSFSFRPVRALIFSRLFKTDLVCPGHHARAMFRPCRDYNWPICTSRQDKTFKIFKTESTWPKSHFHGVSYFLDHVLAIFGPCLGHV